MAEALSDSDFSDNEQTPLDVEFNTAANHLRKITNKLDNNQLLELYGLFKQGIDGKCNTPKPGWLDSRGRRKWEAWKALGDMPKEIAKQNYIDFVQKYDPNWLELSGCRETGVTEAWVAVSSLQYSPEPELIHDELSILEAAREDCEVRIAKLLASNPELKHERDDNGLTALHWAADRDSTKALEALIERGCLIDAVDDCGQTALHYAASCGHIRSTQILIKAGATLKKDDDDCTPLDVAADDDIKMILEGAM
ncbi:unnamed protein product [Diatraea saccharalis]|uniref:Acyl-CoA-binding domain-containing protein 6 n=1 Tax=Diatraea saccharalis TaxID=40085 RepID=A0A9N9RFK5_9NEOP|nr:unnamed protein product [Diatraea saccharalis]